MISVRQKGNFKHTESLLDRIKNFKIRHFLEPYGRKGVEALANATPKDTGKTASSWEYDITSDGDSTSINFYNTNENKGVNIAIILQYGHGTGGGGYVQGRDYINPALQPIFDEIAQAAWKEVAGS